MVERFIAELFEGLASGNNGSSQDQLAEQAAREVLSCQNTELHKTIERLRDVYGPTRPEPPDPPRRAIPLLGESSQISANARLVDKIKAMYADLYGPETLDKIEISKTYSLKRTCDHGHQIADDEAFCPKCGLMPVDDIVYEGCLKEVRELIAESEKLIAGIDLVRRQVAEESLPEKNTVQKVGTRMSSGGFSGKSETTLREAYGVDSSLALFPSFVRLIIDGETRDIPVRRISAIDFWEVEGEENGCMTISRFLDQADLENLEEARKEPNTIFFTLEQQPDFQSIYDELAGWIEALDNGDFASRPALPSVDTAPTTPGPDITTFPQSSPLPPASSPIPRISAVPDQLVREVQGTMERAQLMADRVRIIPSSGPARDLPLSKITSVELQPVGVMGDGFIHFHRLIDDRDLARAVPSAFSSMPTDWSKVDLFRVAFRQEQEMEFIKFRDAVAQSMAPTGVDERLEKIWAALKEKGILTDSDIG